VVVIAGKLREKCMVVKVPRQCPLVLLLKIGWRQGGALGSDDCMVMASGLSLV
jgi:hypothetical protein